MLWSAVAATLVLAASAQDYVDSGYENRRRGSVDEDAGNYEYDYAPDNGLGPTVELGQGIRREPEPRPPPSRLAPAPKRQSFKPRPNDNGYRPRNRAPTGLVGKESCKSGAKSVGHESACDLYYDCYEGQGFLQSCPNGLVYGGDGRFGLVGECDYPHNVNCQGRPEMTSAQDDQVLQDDPCLAKTKVVGDVQYCDRYWECEFGEPELYDCPNGLVWVGKNQGIADGCDYPWRHPNICNNKDLANPPQSTEHCDWLYGIFGHETSCTRYWTCWNGTATEQFCIGGLLYNEETHACDWPQNVAGCQKHPLCKDDANGNVPLGKSCNRYWACQGGYPRLQRCPAMLVFDKDRRRCVTPPTEDCEVPTTSAPLPGEENFNDGSFNGNTGSGGRGQSPNPRRGGGARRRPPQGPAPGGALPLDAPQDRPPLPFNLPPGAQPLN